MGRGKKVQETRGMAFLLPNWVRGGMGSALVEPESSKSAHGSSFSAQIHDSEATVEPPGAAVVPGWVIALCGSLGRWIHQDGSPGDRN